MTPGGVGDIVGAKVLGIFGDSVTTDHISPAGSIKPTSPAGIYLQEHDVAVADFNSYGARRGNHEVMMRGTFANVRIKNLMLPGHRRRGHAVPATRSLPIYDAAMKLHRRRHADGGVRRRGVRHRLLARLGGEGHPAPRRQGGDRAQLRAHPPRQPGRHGRAAAAVHRRRLGRSRSASRATRPSTSSGCAGIQPQQDLTLQITQARRPKGRDHGEVPHRHRDRGRLLPHGGILPFVLRELISRRRGRRARPPRRRTGARPLSALARQRPGARRAAAWPVSIMLFMRSRSASISLLGSAPNMARHRVAEGARRRDVGAAAR